MAARNLGYAEVEQVGTGNRIGTPQPAWKVALTDAGKAGWGVVAINDPRRKIER